MALDVKVGNFTCPASTGNQVISGLGFDPTGIIFWGSKLTATGWANEISPFIGFMDNRTTPLGRSYAWWSDESTTADPVGESVTSQNCIHVLSGSSTTLARASPVSVGTGQFTINWGAVSSGIIIHYMAIGGDATGTRVGDFTIGLTTGNQSVTGLGIDPSIVLFAWMGKITAGSSPVGGPFTYGLKAEKSGFGAATSSTERGISFFSARVQAAKAGKAYTHMRSDACMASIKDSAGTIESLTDFVSMDTGGFTVNVTTAKKDFTRIYFAIAGTSLNQKVGFDTASTSVGTKDTTGLGFDPAAVFLSSCSDAGTLPLGTVDATWCIGGGDGTNDGVVGFAVKDNPPSAGQNDVDEYTETTVAIRNSVIAATTDSEATVSALGTGLFTLDWTTANTADNFMYVALGPKAAGGTSVTVTPNPIALASNVQAPTASVSVSVSPGPISLGIDSPSAGASRATTANWLNGEYHYRAQVSINANKVKSSLTSFPVLLDLAQFDSAHPFWSLVNASGLGIEVTSSDGVTPQSFELVHIDTSTNIGEIHFVASSLSPDFDTYFYLYYGHTRDTDFSSAANVWDANYLGVWHMQSIESTAPSSFADSSTYGHNAEFNQGSLPTVVNGTVSNGKGLNTNANAAERAEVGDNVDLDSISSAITVSFWYRGELADSAQTVLKKADEAGGADGWKVEVTAGNLMRLEYNSTTSAVGISSTTAPSTDSATWQYWTLTADPGSSQNLIAYLNGSSDNTGSNSASIGNNNVAMSFFSTVNDTVALDATLDEVRLSNIARSADWIATEYNNQSNPATFETIGAHQDNPDKTIVPESLSANFTTRTAPDPRFLEDGGGRGVSVITTTLGTWFDNRYSYKVPLVLANIGQTVTDYPYPYYFAEDDTAYAGRGSFTSNALYGNTPENVEIFWDAIDSEGKGLIITDISETVQIPHELVDFDKANRRGEMYFKIAEISQFSDTIVWLYYGIGHPVENTQAANAWNDDYVAVYHCQTTGLIDSTTNQNDAIQQGGLDNTNLISGMDLGGFHIGTPAIPITGIQPSGQTDDYALAPDSTSLDSTTGQLSVTFGYKNIFAGDQTVLSKRENTNGGWSISTTAQTEMVFSVSGSLGDTSLTGSFFGVGNPWNIFHLNATSGNGMDIYRNARVLASRSDGVNNGIPANTSALSLFADPDGSSILTAGMDEIRISKSVPSASQMTYDWGASQYNYWLVLEWNAFAAKGTSPEANVLTAGLDIGIQSATVSLAAVVSPEPIGLFVDAQTTSVAIDTLLTAPIISTVVQPLTSSVSVSSGVLASLVALNIGSIAPTVSVSKVVTIIPGIVSLDLSVPAPSIQLDSSLFAGLLKISLSIPAPSIDVAGEVTILPEVITSTLATQSIGLSSETSISAPLLQVSIITIDPQATTGSSVTPVEQGILVGTRALSVFTASALSVDSVRFAIGIKVPSVETAGTVDIAASLVQLSVVPPTPVIATESLIPIGVIQLSLDMQAVTVDISGTISIDANVLSLSISVPAPSLSTGLNIPAGAVNLALSVLSSSLSAGSSLSPTSPTQLAIGTGAITLSTATDISAVVVQLSLGTKAVTVDVAGFVNIDASIVALSISILQESVSSAVDIPSSVALLSIGTIAPSLSSGLSIPAGIIQLSIDIVGPSISSAALLTPAPIISTIGTVKAATLASLFSHIDIGAFQRKLTGSGTANTSYVDIGALQKEATAIPPTSEISASVLSLGVSVPAAVASVPSVSINLLTYVRERELSTQEKARRRLRRGAVSVVVIVDVAITPTPQVLRIQTRVSGKPLPHIISTGSTHSAATVGLLVQPRTPAAINTASGISSASVGLALSALSPAVSIGAGATISAATGLAVSTLSPTVDVAGTVSIDASAVPMSVTTLNPTIDISGTVSIDAAVLSLSVTTTTSSVGAGSTHSASVINLIVGTLSPSLSLGVDFSVPVLPLSLSILGATIEISGTVSIDANKISLLVNSISPATSTESLHLAGTIDAILSTLLSTLSASSTLQPQPIACTISTAATGLSSGALHTANVINLTASVLQPASISTGSLHSAGAISLALRIPAAIIELEGTVDISALVIGLSISVPQTQIVTSSAISVPSTGLIISPQPAANVGISIVASVASTGLLVDTLAPSVSTGHSIVSSILPLSISISSVSVTTTATTSIDAGIVSLSVGTAQESVSGGATATPQAAKAIVSTSSPSVSFGSNISPSTVDIALGIRQAVARIPKEITVDIVDLSLGTYTPEAVGITSTITPDAIVISIGINRPTLTVVQFNVVELSAPIKIEFIVPSATSDILATQHPIAEPDIKPRSRRKPIKKTPGVDLIKEIERLAKSKAGEDLRKVVQDMADEKFAWMGLRQSDRSLPCVCTEGTGKPDGSCNRCLGTGFGFTDYLVSGYMWMSVEGVEFYTEAGRIATQTRNLVLRHNRPVRKFDQILALDLNPDTGEPIQPFKVLKTFVVQDVMPMRGTRGRLEFWNCIIEERTFTDDKGGETGPAYEHTRNR